MRAPAPTDPGLLDRHAVLEENVSSVDAMGGQPVRWRDVAELSVHLHFLGIEAGERFDRREEVTTHRVTMRHREDVRAGMALRLGRRRFLIRMVCDPDERRRYLVCRCEEET